MYLLGQNPLSKCQGLPVKEMVDHLKKNNETYKNRNTEYEQLMTQCQEIYQPPFVIKPSETVFSLQSKIDKDIRMAVPTDNLYKRKKVPEMNSARKDKYSSSSAAPDIKKQQTMNSTKTTKESAKKNATKAKRDQIISEFIDVQTERENVSNVDFNALFTDNLPARAIELGEYVNSLKDKDNNGEAKTALALEKAFQNLEAVRNISTHTQPFYLMVSDIITPPKGVQMVRP